MTDAWDAWFETWRCQWRRCLDRIESILSGHGAVPWRMPGDP